MEAKLGAMRDHRGAVRRRALARAVPVVLLVTGLTAACTDSSQDEGDAESASPTATPLSEVDLTGVVATRSAFCDALETEPVAAVLGGDPDITIAYDSGQRTEVATGLRDVANEYSCYFERGSEDDQRTARAWLFAQPITPAEAEGFIKEREVEEACKPAGELSFGDPGLVQTCGTGTRRRVTAVGLFGDGWLTCQATSPASVAEEELLEQTQLWCADVARTTASPSAS